MDILVQLCFLRQKLPPELVDKIVFEHMLVSLSGYFAPWTLQQDILLLRQRSEKQNDIIMPFNNDARDLWYRKHTIAKDRFGVFKVSSSCVRENKCSTALPWGGDWIERSDDTSDLRFNQSNNKWVPDEMNIQPLDKDLRIFNEQSNWSDIQILNHIRSVECPILQYSYYEEMYITGQRYIGFKIMELTEEDDCVKNDTRGFSENKHVHEIDFSNTIDDIISRMIRDENFNKNVTLFWIPVIGGPGYIQINRTI